MKYLMLKDGVKMRREIEDAIIFNVEIDKVVSKIHRISLSHFSLLKLLNGTYTSKDLSKMLMEFKDIDLESADSIISKILIDFKDYIVGLNKPALREDLVIDSCVHLISTNYSSPHRLKSPLSISISLTKECTSFCKYCFVSGGERLSNGNSLNTSEVLGILDECKNIGVSTIYFTGGDPFVREDIFEIVEYAVKNDFEVATSTKKILSSIEIQKLVNTGIRKIQYSLDSIENDICFEMVGVNDFASKMLQVVRETISSGIRVNVNAVVTKMNASVIPEMALLLDTIGVNCLYLSPYLRSNGRHSDDYLCNDEVHGLLAKEINNLRTTMQIDYLQPSYSVSKSYSSMCICSGGKMSLSILPDGNVTICERAMSDLLVVGNVRESSMIDIWNSNILHRLVEPSKMEYLDTECFNCEKFESCIINEGSCYARVLMFSEKLFDIDPLCPRSNIDAALV